MMWDLVGRHRTWLTWSDNWNQQHLSPIWKSIYRLQHIFKIGITYSIGNSGEIRLWKDAWSDGQRLGDKSPQLFLLSTQPDITIESVSWMDGCFLGWNLNFDTFVEVQSLLNMVQHLSSIQDSVGNDAINWR
ncbi:hypothetical protein Cni_G23766 [Canna indica]|uniref:Uncharacterized protein n=1 Tax=Canna indica TaxID=4628 RepID=A0AAQ3QNW6_9LILI|nr:hypothetical protein Cni_G23766 [Canna indica]